MIEQLLVAIESSAPAVALRQSVWAYPLVNAGHILGVALLVGGIIPLDLRLLGAWRSWPTAPFLYVLRITVATGLGLAIVCGSFLFSTAATDYAHSSLFLMKMGVVLLGLLNALVLARVLARGDSLSLPLDTAVPLPLRIGALISLVAWVSALVLGRLIGYF